MILRPTHSATWGTTPLPSRDSRFVRSLMAWTSQSGSPSAIPRIGDSSAGASSGCSARMAGHLGSLGPGANVSQSSVAARPSFRLLSPSKSARLECANRGLLALGRIAPRLWLSANSEPSPDPLVISVAVSRPALGRRCDDREYSVFSKLLTPTMNTRFRRWLAPNSEARRLRQTASYPSRESSPRTRRMLS